MRRTGEGAGDGGGIAGAPGEAEIARRFRRQFGRAGAARGGGGDHRGQGIVGDGDPFGRVQRLGAGVGDDQGDRFADMAHLALGQQGLGGEGEGGAGVGVGGDGGAQRSEAVGVEIGRGQHRLHAGGGACGGGVDGAEPGVGVGGAQQHGVGEAGEGEIVEIGAVAGEEARVFPPSRRGADGGSFCHPWTFSPAGGRMRRGAEGITDGRRAAEGAGAVGPPPAPPPPCRACSPRP